ncbi:MAG: hypothetical protein ACTSQK_03020 [Candidatus Heimdallarchaeota archaeon]
MRSSNSGAIWLILSGVAVGFALSLILASILYLQYMIPIFILLVISGFICGRVIGRSGGEFSVDTKSYALILEGIIFGIVFDLMRYRYDWLINIFKYIALGTFFILFAVIYKRNLAEYSKDHFDDGPYFAIMRPSILYILAGCNFAIAINTIVEAFMGSSYFLVLLPLMVLFGVLLMIFTKADFDLLNTESGVWNQLFAGMMLGFAYDLALFRIILWQDIAKLFIVCLMFTVTALVIRMKKPTKMGVGDISLELESTKPRKKKSSVVGEITFAEKKPRSKSKKPTSKKRR